MLRAPLSPDGCVWATDGGYQCPAGGGHAAAHTASPHTAAHTAHTAAGRETFANGGGGSTNPTPLALQQYMATALGGVAQAMDAQNKRPRASTR